MVWVACFRIRDFMTYLQNNFTVASIFFNSLFFQIVILRTEHGTVCYTGRMQGALAYYSCDAGYQLASGEHKGSLRMCLENGRWNDTATICVPLEGIAHIKSLPNVAACKLVKN